MRIPFHFPVRVVPAIFSFTSPIDQPQPLRPGDDVKEEKVTGWRAVRGMFEEDEWGEIKPELATIFTTSSFAMFMGAVYGGLTKSRTVYEEFIRNNHATAFQSHLEAKRALQSKISVTFGKGAFSYGWRAWFFTGMYSGLVNGIAVFRGKQGVFEYFSSGIVVGTLFRMHYGLSGMIVGGGVGGVLGLFCGILSTSLLALAGLSFDNLKQADYEYHKLKREIETEASWSSLKESSQPIIIEKVESYRKEGPIVDNLKTIEDVGSKSNRTETQEGNSLPKI